MVLTTVSDWEWDENAIVWGHCHMTGEHSDDRALRLLGVASHTKHVDGDLRHALMDAIVMFGDMGAPNPISEDADAYAKIKSLLDAVSVWQDLRFVLYRVDQCKMVKRTAKWKAICKKGGFVAKGR